MIYKPKKASQLRTFIMAEVLAMLNTETSSWATLGVPLQGPSRALFHLNKLSWLITRGSAN